MMTTTGSTQEIMQRSRAVFSGLLHRIGVLDAKMRMTVERFEEMEERLTARLEALEKKHRRTDQ